MSGGVDSSLAAALLKEQGHEVIGMTMVVVPDGRQVATDAQRVARALNIEHITLDCTDVFQSRVIQNFCEEYRQGRTPNPCVRCNHHVKFGVLLEKAVALGADLFATGHYARIVRESSGALFRLMPGADSGKDQSYFLYTLDQGRLGKIIMPLGPLTKAQVRGQAKDRALPVHLSKESQDICFLAGQSYTRFLQERLPQCAVPGPLLSPDGRVIGRHRGLMYYTIGQRRGIGIARPAPLYVIALDPGRNAVIAGEKKHLYQDCLQAREVSWIAGAAPSEPLRVHAKIRYLHRPAPAVVAPLDGTRVSVRFDSPQLSITPGQSVVFYEPEEKYVLGGGIINSSWAGLSPVAPGPQQ